MLRHRCKTAVDKRDASYAQHLPRNSISLTLLTDDSISRHMHSNALYEGFSVWFHLRRRIGVLVLRVAITPSHQHMLNRMSLFDAHSID